ncbi:MAG: twin-arginine translocation signal domain-containing protein [Eggerthella lenta]
MELDRRSFLKGAAITGGAAALFGVAGCGLWLRKPSTRTAKRGVKPILSCRWIRRLHGIAKWIWLWWERAVVALPQLLWRPKAARA